MTTISSVPFQPALAPKTTEQTAAAVGIPKLDTLKAMGSSPAVNNSVNAQVLGKVWVPLPSPEQLEQLTDSSDFTDAENQKVLNEVEKRVGKEGLESVLKFDPASWEKHVGVLVAAIMAVNISRQTSAGLKGTYAVMAAEGARAQGMSIIEAGKAVMNSALTAAAVAGTMALGGMTLSLKGQSQKHTDITVNKTGAMEARKAAAEQDIALAQNNFVANPSEAVKTFTVTDRGGKTREINLDPSTNTLAPKDRADLSDEIVRLNKEANGMDLKSALAEKNYSRNITVGQTFSALAMVLSTMISSVVRMEEYAQRQKEVEHQSTQTIARSMTEEQAQEVAQDNALMQKLMEVFMQIMQGRNAASSSIASGMKV